MADNGAAPVAPSTQNAAALTPGNALNERTYQEVEYLKRNLGPILVAALAEICIRRPADPIEYLGHWLLRWRYNEELKRRDVQNALEVVRRKTWTDGGKVEQSLMPNPVAPEVAPSPEFFTEGFIPTHPYGPTGYGGPLTGEQVAAAANEQIGVNSSVYFTGSEDAPPPAELEGQAAVPIDPSAVPAEAAGAEPKRASVGADGQPKRASAPQAVDGQPRRPSVGADPEAQPKRASATAAPQAAKGQPKRPSGEVEGQPQRGSVAKGESAMKIEEQQKRGSTAQPKRTSGAPQ